MGGGNSNYQAIEKGITNLFLMDTQSKSDKIVIVSIRHCKVNCNYLVSIDKNNFVSKKSCRDEL